MSAFDLLNTTWEEPKPYFGFTKLAHGNYEIVKFRLVKNKLYKPDNGKLPRILLVELEDQILFLPEYFARRFKDDDSKVDELNNDGVKKFLHFGGSRPNK